MGPSKKENKMPKLKTKSGAKKRFKMTGTGKVKVAAQGKRHGMQPQNVDGVDLRSIEGSAACALGRSSK